MAIRNYSTPHQGDDHAPQQAPRYATSPWTDWAPCFDHLHERAEAQRHIEQPPCPGTTADCSDAIMDCYNG